MDDLSERLERCSQWFMGIVYVINIIYCVIFITLLNLDGVLLNGSVEFEVLYCFTSGASLVTNGLLVRSFFTHRAMSYRKNLLMMFCWVQFVEIVLDVIYALFYGSLWQDGWIYLILEVLFMLIYFNRFVSLHELSKAVDEGRYGQ